MGFSTNKIRIWLFNYCFTVENHMFLQNYLQILIYFLVLPWSYIVYF
ncbi:MAG: hypothetical protein IPJ09_09240 [Saprospiraceae bacterium]|nr:hypothetical protein [Saprospiraceae bacterium]